MLRSELHSKVSLKTKRNLYLLEQTSEDAMRMLITEMPMMMTMMTTGLQDDRGPPELPTDRQGDTRPEA